MTPEQRTPDDAALRALAEPMRIQPRDIAPNALEDYWRSVDGVTGPLADQWSDKKHRHVYDLIAYALHLRARLAAVEGGACEYGHRQFVNELMPPHDEICAVCRAEHRANQAEQALATVTAERDEWMASASGYGSDMVEWKVRAQVAEQQLAEARGENERLRAALKFYANHHSGYGSVAIAALASAEGEEVGRGCK